MERIRPEREGADQEEEERQPCTVRVLAGCERADSHLVPQRIGRITQKRDREKRLRLLISTTTQRRRRRRRRSPLAAAAPCALTPTTNTYDQRPTQKTKKTQEYRLVAKKGEGTFSEVLKAQCICSGKFVAIKCMKNRFDLLEQVCFLFVCVFVFCDDACVRTHTNPNNTQQTNQTNTQ